MKKFLAGLGMLSLVLLAAAPVLAATTDDVTATVTAQLISVLITSDGTVDYSFVGADTNQDTVALGDTQTATNNGNDTENFSIRSSDAASAGTPWNLAATTDTDQFTHEFSTDGGSSWTDFNADNTTYSSMSSSIAAAGTDDFDLRIKTPTSSTDLLLHTITVTVLATAS